MVAQTLPDELLDAIFAYLKSSSPNSLAACTLVCRAWLMPSTRLLFDTLRFCPSDLRPRSLPRWSLFETSAHSSHRLAASLHTLSINHVVDFIAMQNIVECLYALRSLHLTASFLPFDPLRTPYRPPEVRRHLEALYLQDRPEKQTPFDDNMEHPTLLDALLWCGATSRLEVLPSESRLLCTRSHRQPRVTGLLDYCNPTSHNEHVRHKRHVNALVVPAYALALYLPALEDAITLDAICDLSVRNIRHRNTDEVNKALRTLRHALKCLELDVDVVDGEEVS